MSRSLKPAGISRRQFLIAGTAVGGGLLVGCASPSPENRLGSKADFPEANGEIAINGWVKISPDGKVTVAVTCRLVELPTARLPTVQMPVPGS